jgi:hypothetical protein
MLRPTPPSGERSVPKLPAIPHSVSVDESEVAAAISPSNLDRLSLQVNGIRQVKRHVAHRREDKGDRLRMVDLDVATAYQLEKMEGFKTSVLSQARSLVTTKEEERALCTLPTEALEAALDVSRKVREVKRLGRAEIQARSGYDRSRHQGGGVLSERAQGWTKVEKYETMSARTARSQGWDSRRIPERVASKLKYLRHASLSLCVSLCVCLCVCVRACVCACVSVSLRALHIDCPVQVHAELCARNGADPRAHETNLGGSTFRLVCRFDWAQYDIRKCCIGTCPAGIGPEWKPARPAAAHGEHFSLTRRGRARGARGHAGARRGCATAKLEVFPRRRRRWHCGRCDADARRLLAVEAR